MFYGLAVVCLQCVLWAGSSVNAVFFMSTLLGMNGGRRRLVVVSVAGCGDRHCILPQMWLLGGGVRCLFFTVYSTGWRLCACCVLYMGW